MPRVSIEPELVRSALKITPGQCSLTAVERVRI